MKKKLLVGLLSAVMVLVMMPTAVFAYGTDTVATIGTVEYTSLESAFEAAGNNTIVLQKDATITKCIVVDKTTTLDLNGNKVVPQTGGFTTGTTMDAMFAVKYDGSLTINDSVGTGEITNNGVTTIWAAVKMTETGDVQGDKADAKLTVNGGKLTGYYYAIVGNGGRHGTEITVNGGTLTCESEGLAIYHPQNGKITINGGTLKGYESAIEIRAGELVVNGGTFESTYVPNETVKNGSGTTTKGAAIAVAQHDTKLPISVTINGGTFEAFVPLCETNPQQNPQADIDKVELSVTGGEFEVNNRGSQTAEGTPIISDDEAGFVSGGRFNAPLGTGEGQVSLVNEEKIEVKDGDDEYYVGEDAEEAIKNSKKGDEITIVAAPEGTKLNNVPEGVKITNETENPIVVNGETVKAGATIVAPKVVSPNTADNSYIMLYAFAGLLTIMGFAAMSLKKRQEVR